MTKLDLSALKKQKPAGETTSVVAAIPSVVTAEPAPVVEMPVVATPVATTQESAKAADASSKPKLSLSSFKKPGSGNAVTPAVVAPVVAEVVAPVVEPETVAEVATTVAEITAETVSAESSVDTSASSVESAIETVATAESTVAETVSEAVAPIVEVEPTASVAEVEAAEVSAVSEFFPNLALENDNLFSDIVGMGSFEEEKTPEPVVAIATETPSMEAELEQIASVASEIAAEDSAAILASLDEVPSFEAMMTSAEPIASMDEPNAATASATTTATPVEYVETVAKELSKDRKGGLSELFDKKRKVLYGISAMVVASIGVVGSLYGFGVLDGSKANVVESQQPVIAKVEKEAKPAAEKPVAEKPTTEDSTVEKSVTEKPVVVTPIVEKAATGAVVTTGSGVTAPTGSGTVVATGSGTTAVAPATATGTVAPADANVNTLRTPNVRKKRVQ